MPDFKYNAYKGTEKLLQRAVLRFILWLGKSIGWKSHIGIIGDRSSYVFIGNVDYIDLNFSEEGRTNISFIDLDGSRDPARTIYIFGKNPQGATP